MSAALDLPGFAEPVADAQACFRAVLDAMARPGRVVEAGAKLGAPAPLQSATAAVLLTLVDQETPLWLDPAAELAAGWIAFHCGASRTTRPDAASFVLALSPPELGALNPGTHEAPEASATLILQVSALGIGRSFRLSGPGLAAPTPFQADGLGQDFARSWHDNHALFPRGVDLILCAGTRISALPRSVRIEEV